MQSDFLTLRAAPLLLDICWKSLLVFAAAGLVHLLLRRGSAAGRHALWLSVFVALLCLPPLCFWLPQRALPLLPAAMTQPVPAAPSITLAEVPASPSARVLRALPVMATSPAPTPSSLTAPAERRPGAPVSPAAWLILVWLIGTAAALARTALGLISARRLVRGCVPVRAGLLAEAAEEARQLLALTRPVLLRQDTSGKRVAVPMTFGTRRPVVLLPGGAAEWPAERARVVLLHEMAHIGRGDWAALVVAQIVGALYWFHPFVWLAVRRLRAEAEEACDDRVLACGVPAPDYAGHLLEIVRVLPRRGGAPAAAVVTMARTREIADRLQTILSGTKDRQPVSRRRLVLALLAGVVLVVPLAAMHPARRPAPARVRAVATLTGAPWTARLSDGTLIKLVTVTKADPMGHGIGVPWAPDGTPLGDTALPLTGHGLTTLVPQFPEEQGSIALHMIALPPKQHEVTMVSASGRRRGHWDIGLRVSAGPFTTLVSAPLGQSASQRLPSGEMVVLSKGPTGPQNAPFVGKSWYLTQIRLTIPMRFNTSDYESKIEALGADGKPIALTSYLGGSAEGSGAMRRLLYNFQPSDLKSRHVTSFRFVTRPADHFTFRDVALHPNPPAGATPSVSQEYDPLDTDPTVRARARRQRVKTALSLRKQRQGWAAQNAVLLRQMRQAGPDDLAALRRVHAQVPSSIGLSTGDAQFTTIFGPPTLSHLRRSQGPLEVHLREDFARFRDLRVSQSVNSGPTSITLWASGRVTETTRTLQIAGRPSVIVESSQETAEIAPAYPFLK